MFDQKNTADQKRRTLAALLSTDTRAVNRPSADYTNISLDFNAAPNGNARGTEVIIPDNASPAVRAAAEEYNRRIVEFARNNGIPDYPNRGVKTRSQNGRGVPFTVHTEPFFNNDLAFQNAVDQNFDAFSQIVGDTFGSLEGARIIPPHGVGRDRGATSSVFGDETTFGKRLVQSLIDGGNGAPVAASNSQPSATPQSAVTAFAPEASPSPGLQAIAAALGETQQQVPAFEPPQAPELPPVQTSQPLGEGIAPVQAGPARTVSPVAETGDNMQNIKMVSTNLPVSEAAIARREALAQALQQRSSGARPIEHPLQGVAQLSDALFAGLIGRKNEKDRQGRNEALAAALFGSGGAGEQQLSSDRLRQIAVLNPELGARLYSQQQAAAQQQAALQDRRQYEQAQLAEQRAYAEQQRAAEYERGAPQRELDLQLKQAQLNKIANPAPPKPVTLGNDSRLVDPTTGNVITPAAEPDRFTQLTGEDAQAAGLDPAKAYNVGPDGRVTQIGGGGVNVNVGSGDFKVPTGFKRDPNDPGRVTPIPGGPQDPNTPTSTTITNAAKVNSASTALNQGLDRYRDLVQKSGGQVLPGKDKDALLQARRSIQLQAKELLNLGVLNGPDLDILDQLLVDPTSIGTNVQGTISDFFGGDDVRERTLSSIDQFKKTFEELRSAQTPAGFQNPNATETNAQNTGQSKRLRFDPSTGTFK